uniref:receptor protein-tyrosine kinase n=1 Tax=Parascaris univalens TaxID=6257 RepID=A0A914ZU15_PARUN
MIVCRAKAYAIHSSSCFHSLCTTMLVVLFALLISQCSAGDDVYCRSLDIRNSPGMAFQDKETNDKWSTLSNCTVMEGDFSVSMITSANYTHESFPVFEHLRVITGHLLVFQVSALRSLKRMFPNLRVIGGQELIMNYALVIYQNTHLVEVGLPKLTTIINGGVRIMDNTQLCYSRYIDWGTMLIGPANDILIDQSKSTDSDLCSDECVPEDESRCHKVDGVLSCWDAETCQIQCAHSRNDDKTPGPGCDDEGRRCHEQCLGGCSRPNDPSACHFCKNVIHKGVCIEKCPNDLFEIHHVYLVRRCVTLEECRNISAPVTSESTKKQMLIVENMCRVDCPFGQEIDPHNSSRCIKCEGYCPVKCKGGTIDSYGRINDYHFKKCNVIEGYLEIELRTGFDSAAVEKVGEALGSIEVIEGYLLIDFSISFVSLNMFKRLRLIKGNTLWRDRYALAIFENPNLRQIFDIERQPLSIGNGTVLFQNNRMLCYNRIKAFIDHVGLTDVKENDVSYYSNGDRAICNETTFEVRTEDVHSFGFMISWVAFNTTDMDHRKFLGYQVFYKKVDGPDPNLTIDDDRSACSDSWQMHFEPEKGNAKEGLNRGTGLFGVESNTWYAYYVQTKLINHPGARNAISKIHFVKTLFSPPDPPKDVRGRSTKADQMDLEWDPPIRPNGDITHYVVKWQPFTGDSSAVAGHVCDDKAGAGRRHFKDPQRVTVAVPSATEQPVCSKQPGCCDCNSLKRSGSVDISAEEMEKNGEAAFENAVQNLVFVQHDTNRNSGVARRVRRGRRALTSSPLITSPAEKLYGDQKAILITQNEVNETLSIYRAEIDTATHKINVTTRHLTITGLRHYTQYQIWIHACQNVSAPGGYHCSQRPGYLVVQTAAIPENDLVDNRTIEVINATTPDDDQRTRKITWVEPSNPNGVILAYKVKVIAEDREQTPVAQCVKASDFRHQGGVTFRGLSDGVYRVEVRTITVASLSLASTDEVAIACSLFSVFRQPLFTKGVIALIIFIIFLILTICALIAYYFSQKIFGKKVQEYVRQQISANPEYLSQMDVYKADEWELKRSDIHLEEEIGRGTFGKVYRGYANDVVSHGGVHFGECAVKTVAESANSAERLHFLVEASVMKQFHTSFIVKLYGVVSDGQPVLVVMELMKKGNLRDYLRSRRPGAEENKDNLPIPTNHEYIRWAAQIADGMAYLESIKFCHRDLAARNCMVSADDTVKIGDFGMARDIYYHEYYKPTGKRLMPVRWMAPESLKDGKFTMKSDVWSYGIVLYEMLTLAQQPYSGIGNEEVFNYIGVSRRILARPTDCPDFWYNIMVQCWKYDPRDRPSFAQLVANFIPSLDDDFIEASFVASMAGKASYEESVVDEVFQPKELYPISDDSELVMSGDVVPGDGDEKPICSWNRRTAGSSFRRGAPSDGRAGGLDLEMSVAKVVNDEDEL